MCIPNVLAYFFPATEDLLKFDTQLETVIIEVSTVTVQTLRLRGNPRRLHGGQTIAISTFDLR